MASVDDPWLENLRGKVLLGRYRLDTVLGVGGMGAVFEAVHLAVGRRVAVKLMRPVAGMDATNVERFRQEARAAAAIGRRGVVEVYDLDEDPTLGPFLVMERLDGESLAQRISRLGALTTTEAIRVAINVLDVLAAVHARGIVHRDLKPSNVFFAKQEDGTEWLKLLDFGISHMPNPAREPLTIPGSVLGTARYMAPEQARGFEVIDLRADLYAVGAMLYAMLAGTHPFRGLDALSVMAALRSGHVPNIREVLPTIDDALASVLDCALHPDREKRFPDAIVMSNALRALTGMPAVSLLPAVVTPPQAIAGDTKSSLAATVASGAAPGANTTKDQQTKPDSSSRKGVFLGVFVLLSSLGAGLYVANELLNDKDTVATVVPPLVLTLDAGARIERSIPSVSDASAPTPTALPSTPPMGAEAQALARRSPFIAASFPYAVALFTESAAERAPISGIYAELARARTLARTSYVERRYTEARQALQQIELAGEIATGIAGGVSGPGGTYWYEAMLGLAELEERELHESIAAAQGDLERAADRWTTLHQQAVGRWTRLIPYSAPAQVACLSLRTAQQHERLARAFERMIGRPIRGSVEAGRTYFTAGRDSYLTLARTSYTMALAMGSSESCYLSAAGALQRLGTQ